MSQRFLPTLRRFLRKTSCCAILAALLTWGICPPSADAQVAHTSYLNITSKATTLVKSSAGVLVSVCVNTPNATETIAIYDGLTASGTLIGTTGSPKAIAPATGAGGSEPSAGESAYEFLVAHERDLAAIPTWLFASGPLDHVPAGAKSDVPDDLVDVIGRIGPRDVALFAGSLQPHHLASGLRLLSKLAREKRHGR